MQLLSLFLVTFFIFFSDDPPVSKQGMKKLEKSLSAVFPGRHLIMEKLNLHSPDIDDTDILNADGKWFALKENTTTIAWLLVDKSWGRYHEFEFMMVADTALRVIDVTVLSYPASNGNAVTGKKWLSGFNGFSPTRIPVFRKDIDALSGATISTGRLSESIGKSLVVLGKLKQENLLK